MGSKYEINLVNLVDRFHSEEKCRAYLESLRWPEGVECPQCQSKSISRIVDRNQFDCNACRHQFSVTCGTMFHDSHLPLWKWFLTAYMMVESKKGISANQIKRTLNVSYKTAWYLCHRIRAAMIDVNPLGLSGTIEADEAFVGGKRRGKGRGYKGNKTLVLGAVQRKGDVRLRVAEHADRKTLHDFILANMANGKKRIITDEWASYLGLADELTTHETVNHSAKEWVRGDIHTNACENIWSLLNRSIMGAYHKVSAKHLGAYLNELGFRFNSRENPYLFRDTMRKLVGTPHLQYKGLVGD